MITKEYETAAIFCTGILFDICTTFIGLTFVSHLSESNGNEFIIYLIGIISVTLAIIFAKKLDDWKLTKYAFRVIGIARYLIGIWNTIMICIIF
jgi:hypothetical protein